jgi:hypothetical protein
MSPIGRTETFLVYYKPSDNIIDCDIPPIADDLSLMSSCDIKLMVELPDSSFMDSPTDPYDEFLYRSSSRPIIYLFI